MIISNFRQPFLTFHLVTNWRLTADWLPVNANYGKWHAYEKKKNANWGLTQGLIAVNLWEITTGYL